MEHARDSTDKTGAADPHVCAPASVATTCCDRLPHTIARISLRRRGWSLRTYPNSNRIAHTVRRSAHLAFGQSAHGWAHGPDLIALPVSRPAPPTAVPVSKDVKEHGPLEELGIWRRGSGDIRLKTTCVRECRDESDWSMIVEVCGARELGI